jgi:uncharacterized protein involved in exopolysaccharide biosynthesis
MDTVNPHAIPADEIRLSEVIELLQRGKWISGTFVLVVTIATALLALATPKQYTAVTVLSPVSNNSNGQFGGGLSSLISQFGGLASLAGLSVSGDTKRAESLAVLQSEALTERYIQQNQLLPVLYDKQWDASAKRWNETDPKKIPTLWKANQLFKKKIRTVTSESKTGIVTLEIEWKDPAAAAKWANDLVKMTNSYLRAKAIEESERNIAYLNGEAAKTDVVQVKQAIYAILQTEINKQMLARGSDEYALKVLDPAVPPEKPSSMPRSLMVALAFLGSIALCVLVAFFRVAWSRSP